MRVTAAARTPGLVFLIMCSGANAALADHSIVLQWNSAMLQAIRNTGFAPMRAARGFAVVHTCMYDAWAAYDPIAVGTRLGGSLRRPSGEHTVTNKEQAVSHAAYRALVDLFPTQQSVLFDPLMANLGYDPSETSNDTTTPAGIGNAACGAVLAFRHADGSNQLGDLNGGAPYSDYTGYLPANSHDQLNDPNRWQPLRTGTLPDGTVQQQTFLAPHWGLVTPFALDPPEQYRPRAPAQFGSQQYQHEADAVLRLSAKLNDRMKAIAVYWADGPNTETPPGHWNLLAQWVSDRDGHTFDQDVKLFFALGNALLDASIAVWECKRFYDYIRPISAIRFLYSGQPVKAWGGPGLGTQIISGENFRSYIPTPPFAEFTSGHSAFSASAAEVLRLFTGSDAFGASHTVPAGSSSVEPGLAPAVDVTLSWATFEEAANEAGLSRRYGGIHFKDGDLSSRKMGRSIGAACWNRALTYFNGTAPLP
ncbi:MAG: vanadium-dependent haloperoxidase [Vicinamibacterales bacterium]